MQGKSVLLVDTDARSLRVLEVSLRRAGFEVRSASTGREALAAAFEAPPDIVVTETNLPDFDGFELCHRLTSDPSTAGINLLVLSEERSPEAKIRAISAGADDYLAKPIFVKEIVGRIRALVERRERDSLAKGRTSGFQGALANIGFVDLFQLVETGSKTCVLYVRATPEKSGGFVDRATEGRIYFRDGVVIDAELGDLRAEAAIYRMLLFTDGDFELEFTRLEREERVEAPTQTILLEGMRRVDEWTRLEPALPPLATVLDVDFLALGERVRSLPREVEALLKLVDGKRSILRLIDESGLDDLRALSTVQKLLREGILVDRGRVSAVDGAQPALDTWLKTAPVPVPARTRSYSQVDLPSALGNALIPAPAGASQIFRAVDPLAHSTAIPEPLPEPGRPSGDPIPLTRRKVGAGDAPLPLEKPVTAVPLTVRRVGSMVAKGGAVARSLEAEVAEPEVLLAVDAALAEVAKEVRPARPAAIPSVPPGALPTPSVPPPALAAPAPVEPSKPSLPPRLPPPSDPAPPLAAEPTVEVARPAPEAPAPAAPRPASPPPRAPAAAAPRAPAAAPRTPAPAPRAASRPAPLEVDLIGEPPPPESERASPVVLGILGLGMVAVIGLAAYLFVFQPKQAHVDEYGRPVTDTIPLPPPKAAWPAIPDDGTAKAPAAAPVPAPAPTAAAPAPAPAAPAAAAPAATAPAPAPSAAPAPAPAAPVAAAAKPPVVAAAPAKPLVVAPTAVTPPPKVDLGPVLERGDQALRAERLGDARAAFGEVLATDPKNARALSGLAFAAFSEDKLAEARQLAARSIAANPSHGRAHGVLGWVELAEEKPEPALKHFKLYLKLEPNGPMARDIKAQVAELQKP